jgi:heat shock protein HtpX
MTTPVPQSVLSYSRDAQNHAKAALVVVAAILLVLPLLGVAGYASYAVLGRVMALLEPFDSDYQANREALLAKLSEMDPWQWQEVLEKADRLRTSLERGEIPQDAYRLEMARLVDPKGAAKLQQQREASERDRTLLALLLTLAAAGCLAILARGVVRSPATKALAFCGARPADQMETKQLLDTLAGGMGLPPPKLYVIESPAPNAFTVGMERDHSTIAVTTGLVNLLDRQELESVLAHELSYIGNAEARLNTVAFAVMLFLRLPMLLLKAGRRDRKKEDRSAADAVNRLPVRFLLLPAYPAYAYIVFIAPLLALVVRAAVSRRRTFLADADAAMLLGGKPSLLRALAKVAGAQLTVEGSHPLVSHFYFASPSARAEGFFNRVLLTAHPPLRERIGRLIGAPAPPYVDEAVKAGKDWAAIHPQEGSVPGGDKPADDDLTVLANADPHSSVYRVLDAAPAPLYQRDDPASSVVTDVEPGALVVAFDYSTKMREVLTASQTFGFLPRTVKLEKVNMHPEELFHSATKPAAGEPPAEPPLAMAAVAAAGAPAAEPPPADPAPATEQTAQAGTPASEGLRWTAALTVGAVILAVVSIAGLIAGVILLVDALSGN